MMQSKKFQSIQDFIHHLHSNTEFITLSEMKTPPLELKCKISILNFYFFC